MTNNYYTRNIYLHADPTPVRIGSLLQLRIKWEKPETKKNI